MNHSGGKLKNIAISVFIFAIGIQVAFAALEPYMAWVGRTFALVIIILLLVGLVIGLIAAIRYARDRFGGGGGWNT